jgi:hypothetical protein
MIAETAQVLVDIKATESISTATNKAIGATERLNTSAVGFGTRFDAGLKKAGSGISKLESGLSNMGNHLKSVITGPLGMLGLGAGLFSLGTAFEQTVSKAEDMGVAIEKLSGITGESAVKMSEYLAVTEHFGIPTDRATQAISMLEKSLGKLEASVNKQGVSKLTALQLKYGIALTDTKGRALDATTVLNHLADYYTSNASASQKAALASALLQRGYATLIPVLRLGSKGIADAAAEARDLGLVLTTQNAKDLAQYRDSLRKVGTAIGGLQLQIGLVLLPMVSKLADGITQFLREGGTQKIVGLFHQAADAVRGVAQGVGAVIPVIGGFAGSVMNAWNTIPAELRDWIIKGVVADRTIKFLIGFSPIGAIGSALTSGLKTALSSAFAGTVLSKAFVQPVFVTNWAMMGGGLAGAAEGAAEGAAGAGLAGAASVVLGVGAAAALGLAVAAQFKGFFLDPAYQAQTDAIDKSATAQIDSKATLGELQTAMDATSKGIADLKGLPLGDILYGGQIKALEATRDAYAAAIGQKVADAARNFKPGQGLSGKRDPEGRHGTEAGMEGQRGNIADALQRDIHESIAGGVKQGVGPDMEKLRGKISDQTHHIDALKMALKPTGGGDRGKGSQGDMEGHRGAIGDALAHGISRAIPKNLAKSHDVASLKMAVDKNAVAAKYALTGGLTSNAKIVGGDIESMRGKIAAGLSGVRSAVDRKKLTANTKVTTSVKNQTTVTVSAAAVSKAQYKTTIDQSASYMNTLGNLTGDSSPMAGK